jgi:PAS domain S-box-containing protein
VSRASAPESLCADVLDGLERVGMPAYLVDRHGRIRWLNAAALSLLGDARGRLISSLAAPDHVQRSREQLARKLVGGRSRTDFEIDVIDRHGGRTPVAISSVPVRHGRDVVGVFGVATPRPRHGAKARVAEPELEPTLTPRQHEVLRLLAEGASTEEVAAALGLSEETVRNHIRQLLRRLGVHSRLAAVAYARRHDLL